MQFLLRLSVIVGVLAIGTVALGNMAERWMIYPLDATEATPEAAGLDGVVATKMEIGDETLVVWTAAPSKGHPVIFYLQGNAGNLAARSGRFNWFLKRGYGLIAMAYRGSSGSSGIPSEDALISDAVAVYQQTADGSPRVVYGESIGTAVTIAMLERLGPEGPEAVVLEAPLTSIPDLAEFHYPGTGALAEKLDNTWHSLDRAEVLTEPLLVLHGTDDQLIPIEQGRQIYAAAPSSDKDFITVQGAGHTNLWRFGAKQHLSRFVDQFALR